MPLLSVLTAGYAPKGDYLPETVASVLVQELPAGWDFEWVFQEDGYQPSLGGVARRVPQLRYQANHEPLGIAATRNLALSRARGELIRVLDHDDVLLPGALRRALSLFAARVDLCWVLSRADEIAPGGARCASPPPPLAGAVAPGRMGVVTDSSGHWAVYCAGLTARTDLVRALGGWVAAPRSEDVCLLTALAEISAGYVDQEATWLYRRHPGQAHLSADWQARAAEAARFVAQRLEGIRSARMTLGWTTAAARHRRRGARLTAGLRHGR